MGIGICCPAATTIVALLPSIFSDGQPTVATTAKFRHENDTDLKPSGSHPADQPGLWRLNIPATPLEGISKEEEGFSSCTQGPRITTSNNSIPQKMTSQFEVTLELASHTN